MNVVAQEFREVYPEYVKGGGEKVPGSDEEILQVDPFPLRASSAAAVQELHRIVKKQERRIAELEAANSSGTSRAAADVLMAFGVVGLGSHLLRRRSGQGGG